MYVNLHNYLDYWIILDYWDNNDYNKLLPISVSFLIFNFYRFFNLFNLCVCQGIQDQAKFVEDSL